MTPEKARLELGDEGGHPRILRNSGRPPSKSPSIPPLIQQAPQSYETHVRRLPPLYLATGLVLAANVIFATAVAVRWPRTVTIVQVVVSLALLGLLWLLRSAALVVQNRVIRLEERLRLVALLPDDLKKRIPELSVDQLVALRFASDEELPALVRQAFDEQLTDKDAIKKRVKSWRADHLRV